MPVLDVLKGLFGGAKKPTQADALEAIRRQYPVYTGVADDVLAKAAAAKLPEQFGYLKTFDPKAEIPPEAVPTELRDESFYKANPVLGTKDALDVVERFKKANPKFKNIEAKKIAVALERKYPDSPRVRGLYGRLVGTTEDVPAAPVVPVGPEVNTLGDRREVAAGVRAGGDDRGLPKLGPAQELYSSGLRSFLLGDEDGALKAWGDVAKMDPAHLEARRGVERIMQKRQPPPPVRPESKAVYVTGLQSFLGGRADEAKMAWGRALELDPNNLEAKRGLERLGMAEKAAKAGPGEAMPAGWPQPALPVDDGVGPAQAAFTALSVGADRFNAAVARTPNLIYNVAALPINLALREAGMPEIKDPQLFEGAAKWWDERADEADLAKKYWKGENALSLAKKKDPKELSKYLAYQVMANAPQQALFIASALSGAGAAGLAMMGTTAAAASLAEGREKGASPAAATLNAAMNGVIEAGFENLGTLSIMQKWGKALAKSMGEKAAKGVIADTVKTLFKSVAQEGAEEGLTSLGQDFAQVVTGVDKNAMKGAVGRAIDATAVGALSGGAMTAPVTIASAAGQAVQARAAKDVAGAPAPAGTAPAPSAVPASSSISAASRFADLLPVPTVEEFFRETPEEVAARRKVELDMLKKPEPVEADPGDVSTERAEDFGRVEVSGEVVLAHAKGKHKAALEAWEDKVTPLEVFIRANGGLRIDATERGEFIDVPVRLRGQKPKRVGDPDLRKLPSDMEQMAKEQGIIPAETNIYRELDSIKKRGERPSLSEFTEEARREMEHEYAVYGPPVERPAEAEVEPAPFEKGPGYEAGEPIRSDKPTGYENVPDALMGYSKEYGKQKGFDETKYPYEMKVRVEFDGGDVLEDGMRGMNRRHAMERAKRNWVDAKLITEIPAEVPLVVGHGGVAERQPSLFGGAEPIIVKKPKPGDPGQMTLFGQKAQPKFEVPDSAFKLEEVQPSGQAQQLSMTEEGGHQVDMVIPRALRESVIIKDLAEQGFLPVHKMRVESPADTAAIFHFLKNQTVESFYILAKDVDGKILGAELVSLGIIDQTLVNPRDSLKGAMLMGAKKLSLVHNHPSGNPTPSKEDLAITRVLARAAESVGMVVDHHVVINDTKYGVIELDQDGAARARIETRRGAPPAAGERTRLVKPMRTSASDEAAITTPEAAVTFAKGVQGGQGGVMLIAMDTRNQPTGAWYLGEDFPTLKDLTRDVGRIVMRNNAAGVIFSSGRMPQKAYMEAVSKEMRSVWSVNVLDFVAPRGKSGVGGFESARQSGVMGEGKSPYGEFEQPYSPQKLHSRPPAPPAEESPEGQAELAFDVTEEDMKEAEEIFGKEMTEAELFATPAANRTRKPPQDVLDALLAPEERLNDLALGEAGKFSTLAPLRAVERMDGKRFGLMKERFLKPIQDADKAFQKELKDHREEVAHIFDGMSLEERNLVFDLVENKEQSKIVQAMEEGAVFEGMDWKERKLVMDVLNGKVKRDTVKPGTRAADALEFFTKEKGKFSRPGERVLNAVSFLRMAYDDLLDRINKARADIGKDPIRKRDNYITHYQEMSAINDILMMMGHNMTEVPASMLTISAMTKPNSPYFKFAKRRLGEKTDRDARQAFSIYLEPALRAIHFSRAIKNGRDILEYKVTIPSDYEGGKTDSLSLFGIRYPNAYKYLTEYLNRLSGKRDSMDRDHPGAAAVAALATRLFGPGSIGGNIGTILVQPSSLRNTVTETGLFAVKGHMEIMTPDGMRFYRKNSRVGMGRAYEPSAKNERLMGSKTLARAHDLAAETLAIPVGAVDHLMVGGAFLAGYHKGKSLGLNEADAVRYADDVAERTQASANVVDRPPANASKIRVALFQFQTFVYNEYSQIKNDVFRKMMEGDRRNKQGYAEEGLGALREGKDAGYRRFAWLVLATIVLGQVIDELGLPNPYRDDEASAPFYSSKWTDWVWQHIINSIPGVSSVRFGGSPLVKGVLAGMAYLSGDDAAKARAKSRLKNIGVRVIPGGGQISKSLSAVPILGKTPDLADKARALIYGKWILNKKTAAYRKLRKRTLKDLAAVRAGELDYRKMGAEEKADLRRRIGAVRGIERQRRSLAKIDKAGGRGPRVDAFRKKLQEQVEAME